MGIFLAGFLLFYSAKPAPCKGPNSIEIQLPLSVESALLPDEYFFRVEAVVKASTEKEVLKILGALDAKVRKLKIKYKGGKFYTSQNCIWKKESLVCQGYKGSIFYTFEGKSPVIQEKAITPFMKLKNLYPGSFSYFVRGQGWEISPSRSERERTKLILELEKKALEISKQIAQVLSGTCSIEKINYKSSNFPIFPLRAEKSLSLPEPTKDIQTLKVRAVVTLKCFQGS